MNTITQATIENKAAEVVGDAVEKLSNALENSVENETAKGIINAVGDATEQVAEDITKAAVQSIITQTTPAIKRCPISCIVS